MGPSMVMMTTRSVGDRRKKINRKMYFFSSHFVASNFMAFPLNIPKFDNNSNDDDDDCFCSDLYIYTHIYI